MLGIFCLLIVSHCYTSTPSYVCVLLDKQLLESRQLGATKYQNQPKTLRP